MNPSLLDAHVKHRQEQLQRRVFAGGRIQKRSGQVLFAWAAKILRRPRP